MKIQNEYIQRRNLTYLINQQRRTSWISATKARGTIAGKPANRYNENPKWITFKWLILTFLLNRKEKF
jgi:hypothetical protein